MSLSLFSSSSFGTFDSSTTRSLTLASPYHELLNSTSSTMAASSYCQVDVFNKDDLEWDEMVLGGLEDGEGSPGEFSFDLGEISLGVSPPQVSTSAAEYRSEAEAAVVHDFDCR